MQEIKLLVRASCALWFEIFGVRVGMGMLVGVGVGVGVDVGAGLVDVGLGVGGIYSTVCVIS
jgi:hypothetical protein